MKVKFIKKGKVAIHPAFGPIIKFEKDQELSTVKSVLTVAKDKFTPNTTELQLLIDVGLAELVEGADEEEESSEEPGDEENDDESSDDDKKEDEDGDEEKPLIEDLMKKLEIVTDTNEKKSIIEDWATVNLGIDLDRRKSVPKMLAVVQKNL